MLSRALFLSLILLISGCGMFDNWNAGGASSGGRYGAGATATSYFEERIRQLNERVAALEQRNANLEQQVFNLQAQLNQAQGGASAAELQQLRARVQELQIQREKDKQVILDEVSRIVADMAASRRPAPSGGGSEVGYEHKVEAGQTLFDIAKAYGVTVADIKKANNLSSDLIRVGQVLFIPKGK